MKTRIANAIDREGWLKMRSDLWPNSIDKHFSEIDEYLAGKSRSVSEVIVCELGTTQKAAQITRSHLLKAGMCNWIQ